MIVGTRGVRSTLATLRAGKRLSESVATSRATQR